MTTIRQTLRVAHRLQEVFEQRAAQEAEQALLRRLAGYQQALEQTRALVRTRGHPTTANFAFILRRHLLRLVQEVKHASQAMQQEWPALQRNVPSLGDLVADLRQLEEEFEEVHWDLSARMLSVTTAPITLEEVYLGPFAIRLTWSKRSQGDANLRFAIVALDPQPAAGNEDVTHPHVKDETLCAGDASVPLQQALRQGRLVDAFCLIHGVLTHYNPGSPYAALDHWNGQDCHECGCSVDTDELWYCEECGEDFCSECTNRCNYCDALRCNSCLDNCRKCDAACCRHCQVPNRLEGAPLCRACHQEEQAAASDPNTSTDSLDPNAVAVPAALTPDLTGVPP